MNLVIYLSWYIILNISQCIFLNCILCIQVSDYHYIPDTPRMSERLRVCLQEGDEVRECHYANTNSPYLSPYIYYSRSREKMLKYQVNSHCMIISFILITLLKDKALILKRHLMLITICVKRIKPLYAENTSGKNNTA